MTPHTILGVESRFSVAVRGGVLTGIRCRSGEPLLVLHGGPGLTDYSGMLAAELTGWDALRYTQRGVAPSVTAGPFTVSQHVSDALAVLDHHGVSAAVVLGHSWGGYLAMQLAAAAPDRVRALVLVDTLGATGDGGLAGFAAALTARSAPGALSRAAELDALAAARPGTPESDAAAAESLRLTWPAYFADPQAAPEPPPGLRFDHVCYTETFESITAARATGLLPAQLAECARPVEIVAGEASPFPLDVARATAAVFPGALVTVAGNAGHFPWVEQPGCVTAALGRVQARLPG
jgi:proline iminopeptidase